MNSEIEVVKIQKVASGWVIYLPAFRGLFGTEWLPLPCSSDCDTEEAIAFVRTLPDYATCGVMVM